ncbi:hypothetical protein [Chryseobacterium lathyri]|uniref:Uncharacterized protein n=1 Tax=Chryseobacterium lathyri TaxID=395933 RepID=A0A511YAB7_9FLAO|nr:hypothetical protein [Chryseobacterium lathyri]GEN72148.1 hypothetical protein CLA01_22200 [Chryseobacterium lathyri]
MTQTEIISKFTDKKIIGIVHDYYKNRLTINFDNNLNIIFEDCVLAFDSGVIKQIISFISFSGTLGMTLELKSMGLDPEKYNFIIFSKDITDYENKSELKIAYKKVKIY